MKSRMTIRRSLAARITTLSIGGGLVVILAGVLIVGTLNTAPTNLKAILIGVVVLVLPIWLGWTASRLIGRPLRQFDEAMASLKTSNYQAKLPKSEVAEFDQVFQGFNELIARLQHEEELRRNLISDTSHELNTPLTALSGQLTAMQEGALPLTKDRIDGLKQQVDRLNELVKSLDTYSRARLPLDKPAQDILVLKSCRAVLTELDLPSSNPDIVLDIPEGLTITGDPAVLHQIIANILQNSLQYAEADHIRISANERELVIADDGKGVPKDTLEHLFERFYRVDPSRSRVTGGLGLGLAIVKELVERQGWTIRAQRTNPGLKFVIMLRP